MHSAADCTVRLTQRADGRPLDASFSTRDGRIWPRPRHEMESRGPILERMAEDAERLIREGDADLVIDITSLTRLGWTADQARDHGPVAIATAGHRIGARRHAA